ncbi:MAG: biopolymer transporter Tol [Puniceicoccaceae bacterium]
MSKSAPVFLRSLLSLVVFLGSFSHAQPYTDLPSIVGSERVRVVNILIDSPDARISGAAIRAFNLHGGFTPVRSGEQARLTLRPNGERSVILNLAYQGQNFTETISGDDWLQATLLASDRAVERITGAPGFFAGKIAFVGENTGHKEIYVGDILFQQLRRITTDQSTALSPRWSPDGTRILYTTYFRTGFPDIYEIDLRNNNRRPFATYKGVNNGAAFSPDGSQVAMIISSSGNPELYVSDASGRAPRRLTNNRSAEASPTWSPDGRRLALVSDQLAKPQIFIYNLTTNEFTRLRTNISGYCAEPSWNPKNPDEIAFTISQGGGFQLAIFSFSKGTSRNISREGGDAIEPAWLPDGRHLLYTRRNGGKTELRIIDSFTGKTAPLHAAAFGNASQASFVMPRR